MRSLAKRPRLLLLDANAVFAAFRYGAWDGLCAAYEVVVPATVVRVEAMFYDSRETGRRVYLDLPALVDAGTITEYAAGAVELADTLARFRPPFRQRLDPGEAEAIAYLLTHPDGDLAFVTSAASALEAVAMLGIAERAMCLAEVLRLCGLERTLPRQHGVDFFRQHIQIGLRRFVTREGLE
jgi:hypothetical protein